MILYLIIAVIIAIIVPELISVSILGWYKTELPKELSNESFLNPYGSEMITWRFSNDWYSCGIPSLLSKWRYADRNSSNNCKILRWSKAHKQLEAKHKELLSKSK